MEFTDVAPVLEKYAKDLTADELDTSVNEKASNKGMTFILKTKRTRHTIEGIVRGAPGLHTFTVFVPFSGETTTSSTRKIVDIDNKSVNTVESPTHSINTIDELKQHIDDWSSAVNQIEQASRASVQESAKNEPVAATPQKPKKRTAAKNDDAVESSRTKTASPKTDNEKPSSYVHVTKASTINTRFYVLMGDWYVPKVAGEYTAQDHYARIPDTDPRKAQHYLRRFLPMPQLNNHTDDVSEITPYFQETIPFREEDGGIEYTHCRHILRD